jgi:hypothetical protein
VRTDLVYEPERGHLKIVVTGPPGATAELMSLIQSLLGSLQP